MLAQRTTLFKALGTATAWFAAKAAAASADQFFDLTVNEIRNDVARIVREGEIFINISISTRLSRGQAASQRPN